MSYVCSPVPSVKYNYDIAMIYRAGSQRAVLLLTGLVRFFVYMYNISQSQNSSCVFHMPVSDHLFK